ncbi:exonuclease tos isoform X2 [Nomia melanderi]|uniref:exonuclease tos isoform X2 n=1 Tax=Nomia melanderi TaxID=2448451 RepID=UPI0013044D55|nr:exonuclease 1 isoform X2 [Nomia melanderi]
MGITGLLPFLEKSSKRTNINEFAGKTVAIDSYCWLHKGVFSCADKLSMGQPTDAYVQYCMRFIYMLLSHKIKPVLVFDGRYLPAKAQTEAKRREAREANRRKAVELMKMGQHAEGRNLLRRSIDVTHEMALELIKQSQKINVDCIVAPYEADAQLAYLNISGIVDLVITEDSDLTLFGCTKVFFKMDINGNGLLVDQERLHLAMGLRAEHFNMDSFRNMCILSGCDYLPSLPGIGLNKAKKFITINTDCDIHRALTRLGSYLNMKSLVVTKEYRDAFILAIITFKHQLVFCPLQRKQVRLNPPLPDVTEDQLYYAGTETDPDTALQLAFGNCDPFSLKMLHNFDPDKIKSQDNHNAWSRKSIQSKHVSIWSKQYKLKKNDTEKSHSKDLMTWPNTANKEVILQTNRLKTVVLAKQNDNIECIDLNQKELLDIYKSKDNEVENNSKMDTSASDVEKISPVLIKRIVPFSQQISTNKTSPSLLSKTKSRIKGRNIMRIRRTIINDEIITESKFFAKTNVKSNNNVTDDDTSCSSSNSNENLRKKENTTLERIDEIDNIDHQSLIAIDEIETNSDSMDVDEECNTSFTSNQCNDVDNSSSPSTCDLGKSYLDVRINEFVVNKNSNESHIFTDSLTTSETFEDQDFLIPREDINTLNSNLFQWSNTKLSTHTNNKTKHYKSKRSASFDVVKSKTTTTNSIRKNQQLSSMQSRQSLLSTYGFKRKELM